MINAKQEFLDVIKNQKLICAIVEYTKQEFDFKFELSTNHSLTELEFFLDQLDFEYEPYCSNRDPQFSGTIWMNGCWAEREAVYGFEHWKVYSRPPIPESLG